MSSSQAPRETQLRKVLLFGCSYISPGIAASAASFSGYPFFEGGPLTEAKFIMVLSPLQMQKQKYHYEKRRVAQELLHTLKDPAVVVMADWLKIRGSLRKWMKVYCVLKPGMLLLYKSAKTHKVWLPFLLSVAAPVHSRFHFSMATGLEQSYYHRANLSNDHPRKVMSSAVEKDM